MQLWLEQYFFQVEVVEEVLGISPCNLHNKLVGIGTDGASVNLGSINGIVTRLRLQWAPFMENIHCMAHCLQVRCGNCTCYLLKSLNEAVMRIAHCCSYALCALATLRCSLNAFPFFATSMHSAPNLHSDRKG